MARKKPETPLTPVVPVIERRPAPSDPKRVVAVYEGHRMLLNERGDVVVVQRRGSSPYFPNDVRGVHPEAAVKLLRTGEVELHASSVVDVDPEDDTAPSDDSASPSGD